MRMTRTIVCIVAFFISTLPVLAAEDFSTLYRIQTYRAAPGDLVEFIELNKTLGKEGFYDSWSDRAPFMLRHSQGDHWDIMLIHPMGSYGEYFSEGRLVNRRAAHGKFSETLERLDQVTSFKEDHFVAGPSLNRLETLFEENDFYHIEIFYALAGKKQSLIEQRQMENDYLSGIGTDPNVIFIVDGGGDADVMTIGFYKSLQDFAAPSSFSDAEKNEIAQSVGFTSRDDIGPYLRSLIATHQDTLAVSVP